MTTLRLQHNSLQFSDSHDQHVHDLEAIFGRARQHHVFSVDGTEAGSESYRKLLIECAHDHGFGIMAHHTGDWVALNRKLADIVDSDWTGPFIPAKARFHSARGITWMSAHHRHDNLGLITVGAAHYLAPHSVQAGETNAALVDGIAKFGRTHGGGKKVVFFNADANEHDDKVDVFHGEPFTTIADELGKHPATHGRNKQRGSAIDIIASYDHDGRVRGRTYRVLDDSDLRLFGDHFLLDASFEVAELG